MNCDQARYMIDGYLEKRLNRYDARRLEQHLSRCALCARELRERPLLERQIQHALVASVHQRRLSAEASSRIVGEAQSGVRRGIWSKRAYGLARLTATVAAMCLALAGLFYLVRDVPRESSATPITLFPVHYMPDSDRQSVIRLGLRDRMVPDILPADAFPARPQSVSLNANDVRVEPWKLRPGQMFTITLLLQTNLPQPIESARLDLDVNGPTGYYSFEIRVRGHLPSRGISVVRLTPDVLEASSQEKYLMSPTEIFHEPGVYTLRFSTYTPVMTPAR
jgi:hypothetical protein